ncbi:hypothetical protein BH09CHL1_BH09CHL1_18060 [soil metagenome]
MARLAVILCAILMAITQVSAYAQSDPLPVVTAEVAEGSVLVTSPVQSGDYVYFTIRITNQSDFVVYADTWATNFDAYWFVSSPSTATIAPGESVDIPARHPMLGADQVDGCNNGGVITPYSAISWQIHDANGLVNVPSYFPGTNLTLVIDCRPLAATPTPTATATSEPTPTATATSEPTPTSTATSTPEPTPTATATGTPGPTPTATATSEPTPIATATSTPEPTSTTASTQTPGVFPPGVTPTTTVTALPSTGAGDSSGTTPLALMAVIVLALLASLVWARTRVKQ